jgi:hypothetical protein
LHGRAQGAVPGRAGAVTGVQQVQQAVDPAGQVFDRQAGRAARGQLDGQRQAVQPGTVATTAGAVRAVSANAGLAAVARSTNSRTAGTSASCRGCVAPVGSPAGSPAGSAGSAGSASPPGDGAAGSRTGSGRTGQHRSPDTRSGSRLVARTVSRGHRRSRPSTSSATSATR